MKFEYRVSLGPSHGSAHVVTCRLSTVATVEFPQDDKGDENQDEQDDRYCDPHLGWKFRSHSVLDCICCVSSKVDWLFFIKASAHSVDISPFVDETPFSQ